MTRDEHFLLISHQSHAKAGSCDKSLGKQFESIHFPERSAAELVRNLCLRCEVLKERLGAPAGVQDHGHVEVR